MVMNQNIILLWEVLQKIDLGTWGFSNLSKS